MAGRTFLMDGQVISNDGGNNSEEGEGYSDDEEMEYMHNADQGQFQQEYDHDNDHSGDNDEEFDTVADENVPSMPTGFYSEVDQFLSRPPPGITLKNPKGGKKKKKGGSEGKKKQLPDIPDSQSSLSHVQSKVSTRRGGTGKKSSSKVMDERLLQQAFEYTNKLQQEAMVEEVYEASMSLQNQKSSSAPQLRPPQYEVDQSRAGGREGGGSGSGGIAQRKPRSADAEYSQGQHSSSSAAQRQQAAYGQGKKKHPNSVVRRLRSKTQASSDGGSKQPRNRSSSGGFDTSCDKESATSTRNVTDFNSLVANFEQGTHLQQLREELEQSKTSMAESRRAMQDISKEMSGKMRI